MKIVQTIRLSELQTVNITLTDNILKYNKNENTIEIKSIKMAKTEIQQNPCN